MTEKKTFVKVDEKTFYQTNKRYLALKEKLDRYLLEEICTIIYEAQMYVLDKLEGHIKEERGK